MGGACIQWLVNAGTKSQIPLLQFGTTLKDYPHPRTSQRISRDLYYNCIHSSTSSSAKPCFSHFLILPPKSLLHTISNSESVSRETDFRQHWRHLHDNRVFSSRLRLADYMFQDYSILLSIYLVKLLITHHIMLHSTGTEQMIHNELATSLVNSVWFSMGCMESMHFPGIFLEISIFLQMTLKVSVL